MAGFLEGDCPVCRVPREKCATRSRNRSRCSCGRHWSIRLKGAPIVNGKIIMGILCKTCDTLEEK